MTKNEAGGRSSGLEALTFRQLRYFIAVAEFGSVTKAADVVGISPSAITAAVQALEEQTGAPLVVRHQRGMRLSHEGQHLLRHARRIVSAVADAGRAVRQKPDDLSGDLNLGVTHMVSGYYLADFLARFRRVFRRVIIHIVEADRASVEHLLVSGEIDVGLMLISNLRDRRALATQTLVQSPWRVWLPARHPLLAASVLTLAQIAREGMIMLAADELAETTTRGWAAAGLRPNVVMRTSSVEAVRSLVATGAGIATLPDLAFRPWSLEGDKLESRHLSDTIPNVDVGLAWRKGAPLRPAAHHFIDLAGEFGNA